MTGIVACCPTAPTTTNTVKRLRRARAPGTRRPAIQTRLLLQHAGMDRLNALAAMKPYRVRVRSALPHQWTTVGWHAGRHYGSGNVGAHPCGGQDGRHGLPAARLGPLADSQPTVLELMRWDSAELMGGGRAARELMGGAGATL